MNSLCITTERLAVPTSIGCNAGAFIQSVEDGFRQVPDRNRIVFVRIGDSPVAVPFQFIAFHGEDI